jgi:hypothetical protein
MQRLDDECGEYLDHVSPEDLQLRVNVAKHVSPETSKRLMVSVVSILTKHASLGKSVEVDGECGGM